MRRMPVQRLRMLVLRCGLLRTFCAPCYRHVKSAHAAHSCTQQALHDLPFWER